MANTRLNYRLQTEICIGDFVLKIRLRRVGGKKQPSYRIVLADSREARDGAFIEQLGLYDPKQDAPNYHTEDYSDEIGERFSSTLISRINLSPRSNSDIIDVSYTSVWPEEAKLIINTIADLYKQFDETLSSVRALWCLRPSARCLNPGAPSSLSSISNISNALMVETSLAQR